MAKYELSWVEVRTAIVEADNRKEAINKVDELSDAKYKAEVKAIRVDEDEYTAD